jgi:mono/diheme cytochrome c family protein
MRRPRTLPTLASLAMLWSMTPALAQPAAPAASDQGAVLVATKCFQCHTDAMFRDGRQDRRAWEATIYRMVGRGGLFTADEIKSMAAYLGEAYGPDVKPAGAAK